MLKKAGIVVAAAAAGLLAVSPLAFAGDKDDDHKGYDRGSSVETNETNEDNDSIEGDTGLVNISDNNTSVPVNVCDNQVPVNVLGVQVPINDVTVLADLTGALGLGLLGDGVADADDDGSNVLDDSCNADSDIDDAEQNSISD